MVLSPPYFFFFFFNVPAPTEIYTLSLHDALPISFLLAHAQRNPATALRMAGHALLPKICRGLLLGGLPVRIVTAQAAEASRAAAIAIAKAHKQIVLEQIILRRRLAGEGHEKNAER